MGKGTTFLADITWLGDLKKRKGEMVTKAGRGSEWHDMKLVTKTRTRSFRTMQIVLWIFGLHSKSNGKRVEGFKQRSDVTRCLFFKRSLWNIEKKTRRAKAKVGEQQNKVVLNYNTKYKINIHKLILISISDWIKIHWEEQMNLPCRIPNKLCLHSAPEQVEHNSPLLKC